MKIVSTSWTPRKCHRDSSEVYGPHFENSRYRRCNEWLKVSEFLPQLCLRLVLSTASHFTQVSLYLPHKQVGLNNLYHLTVNLGTLWDTEQSLSLTYQYYCLFVSDMACSFWCAVVSIYTWAHTLFLSLYKRKGNWLSHRAGVLL